MLLFVIVTSACNQNLNSSSGFILSPYYPGYYINNVTCTWYVTAPENHVIRLEFQSFALESHPTCANDYVEVRDGDSHRSHRLGKYCGHTFPPVIESSSNALTVVFKSNDANIRTGFKAVYRTVVGELNSQRSSYLQWYSTIQYNFSIIWKGVIYSENTCRIHIPLHPGRAVYFLCPHQWDSEIIPNLRQSLDIKYDVKRFATFASFRVLAWR